MVESLDQLEAAIGIEPMNKAFAELCLTTWLRRHIDFGLKICIPKIDESDEFGFIHNASLLKTLERETRFELATSTLARSRSTTELLPLTANNDSTN